MIAHTIHVLLIIIVVCLLVMCVGVAGASCVLLILSTVIIYSFSAKLLRHVTNGLSACSSCLKLCASCAAKIM